MSDPHAYIRGRLREARIEADLSQKQVAEKFGCNQVTYSDMERGRTKVGAADLVRLAAVLKKPVVYFLPDVPSELSDEEQALLGLFRQLSISLRSAILETARDYLKLAALVDDLEVKRKDRALDYAIDEMERVASIKGYKVTLDEKGLPCMVSLTDAADSLPIRSVSDEDDLDSYSVALTEELARRIRERQARRS